ncbi:hypothetical protein HK102_013206 [Quaeritorhiza haematococci]|nr:hypothetical protein HK102_013206 [Quaeritorhiza haematococci]
MIKSNQVIGIYEGKEIFEREQNNTVLYEFENMIKAFGLQYFDEQMHEISPQQAQDLGLEYPDFKSPLLVNASYNCGYFKWTAEINDFREDPFNMEVDADDQEAEKVNCAFVEVVIMGWPYIFIVATKTIRPGQELLADYHFDTYWKNIRTTKRNYEIVQSTLRITHLSQQGAKLAIGAKSGLSQALKLANTYRLSSSASNTTVMKTLVANLSKAVHLLSTVEKAMQPLMLDHARDFSRWRQKIDNMVADPDVTQELNTVKDRLSSISVNFDGDDVQSDSEVYEESNSTHPHEHGVNRGQRCAGVGSKMVIGSPSSVEGSPGGSLPVFPNSPEMLSQSSESPNRPVPTNNNGPATRVRKVVNSPKSDVDWGTTRIGNGTEAMGGDDQLLRQVFVPIFKEMVECFSVPEDHKFKLDPEVFRRWAAISMARIRHIRETLDPSANSPLHRDDTRSNGGSMPSNRSSTLEKPPKKPYCGPAALRKLVKDTRAAIYNMSSETIASDANGMAVSNTASSDRSPSPAMKPDTFSRSSSEPFALNSGREQSPPPVPGRHRTPGPGAVRRREPREKIEDYQDQVFLWFEQQMYEHLDGFCGKCGAPFLNIMRATAEFDDEVSIEMRGGNHGAGSASWGGKRLLGLNEGQTILVRWNDSIFYVPAIITAPLPPSDTPIQKYTVQFPFHGKSSTRLSPSSTQNGITTTDGSGRVRRRIARGSHSSGKHGNVRIVNVGNILISPEPWHKKNPAEETMLLKENNPVLALIPRSVPLNMFPKLPISLETRLADKSKVYLPAMVRGADHKTAKVRFVNGIQSNDIERQNIVKIDQVLYDHITNPRVPPTSQTSAVEEKRPLFPGKIESRTGQLSPPSSRPMSVDAEEPAFAIRTTRKNELTAGHAASGPSAAAPYSIPKKRGTSVVSDGKDAVDDAEGGFRGPNPSSEDCRSPEFGRTHQRRLIKKKDVTKKAEAAAEIDDMDVGDGSDNQGEENNVDTYGISESEDEFDEDSMYGKNGDIHTGSTFSDDDDRFYDCDEGGEGGEDDDEDDDGGFGSDRLRQRKERRESVRQQSGYSLRRTTPKKYDNMDVRKIFRGLIAEQPPLRASSRRRSSRGSGSLQDGWIVETDHSEDEERVGDHEEDVGARGTNSTTKSSVIPMKRETDVEDAFQDTSTLGNQGNRKRRVSSAHDPNRSKKVHVENGTSL